MFSSIAASPVSTPSIPAIATNWSSSSPAMLAITAVPVVRRYGRWCSMKCAIPSLSRPIALSRPDAVSTVRGVGFPARGRNVNVLGITPPSRSSRTNGAISRT